MNDQLPRGEGEKEDLQIRLNKAAIFLIQNGIVGTETDNESQKTADALRNLKRFEGINPGLTGDYADFVNSASQTVAIYGEKGKRFFLGVDAILSEFVNNSDLVIEVEKSELESKIQDLGEVDITRELTPMMLKDLLQMIGESNLKDIFENQDQYHEALGSLKLSPFVYRLTDTLIHHENSNT